MLCDCANAVLLCAGAGMGAQALRCVNMRVAGKATVERVRAVGTQRVAERGLHQIEDDIAEDVCTASDAIA